MIKATCQKLRHGVAAVALTVVGLCHPAYAAEFIVNWDPLFNPALADTLGWKGVGNVVVDAGCLTPNSTQTVGRLACTSAALTSFTLDFYDGAVSNVFDSFSEDDAWWIPGIRRLHVDATGKVDAIDFDRSSRLSPPVSGLSILMDRTVEVGSSDYVVALDFIMTGRYSGPTLMLVKVPRRGGHDDDDDHDDDEGQRFGRSSFNSQSESGQSVFFSGVSGNTAPRVSWSAVPEPSTLLLVGGVLGALGLRRRKA